MPPNTPTQTRKRGLRLQTRGARKYATRLRTSSPRIARMSRECNQCGREMAIPRASAAAAAYVNANASAHANTS
eukprot:8380042-Lingulodinium_polyedra.AAC.1